MSNLINILTERLLLRELIEEDASERYLSWFSDNETNKFISMASSTNSLSDLRKYIFERKGREDVVFLGIFEKNTGLHIGNIKYEPVNTQLGYAIMGLMIGDPEYRGKGVGTEVLKASGEWLKLHCNINQIVLGVSKENVSAIRSYQKAGFLTTDTPYIEKHLPEVITMVWNM